MLTRCFDALDEAFGHPYAGFSFRRKGHVEDIRDTGSRRLEVQLSFGGREWQTLQLEIAKPEADEIELVHVAVGISDFGLDGPEEVACLSLRFPGGAEAAYRPPARRRSSRRTGPSAHRANRGVPSGVPN